MIHTVQDTFCDTQTEPENAIDDHAETHTPVARLISQRDNGRMRTRALGGLLSGEIICKLDHK